MKRWESAGMMALVKQLQRRFHPDGITANTRFHWAPSVGIFFSIRLAR